MYRGACAELLFARRLADISRTFESNIAVFIVGSC